MRLVLKKSKKAYNGLKGQCGKKGQYQGENIDFCSMLIQIAYLGIYNNLKYFSLLLAFQGEY